MSVMHNSILKKLYMRAILPYTRREWPYWHLLLAPINALGAKNDGHWEFAKGEKRTVVGKFHGYTMSLDISEWSQRYTFVLARYYELDLQLFLMTFLQPGDNFVDVGTNIGMISLVASKCVGDTGKVVSFEPNPVCLKAVAETIELNNIDNIFLQPYALSDKESICTLTIASNSSGIGTLAKTQVYGENDESSQFVVETRLGDSVLSELLNKKQNTIIKIDVEGHECKVLAGIQRLLKENKPVVITEFEPKHLRRSGNSPEELFDMMSGLCYIPFDLKVEDRFLLKPSELCFKKINDPKQVYGRNIFWFNKAHSFLPGTQSSSCVRKIKWRCSCN